MTPDDYLKQFRRSMTRMPHLTAGKDPMENTDEAIGFLFDNCGLNIGSAKELEGLILETAGIVNGRNAEADGAMWHWFTSTFWWMLTSQCFEPEETAAFAEYMINAVGHFFEENCLRISMLISTFVFMRFNLPCPRYTSEDEYIRVTARTEVPELKNMRAFLADPGFENFLSYYLSICPGRENEFYSYFAMQDNGLYICRLMGYLSREKSSFFGMDMDNFYEEHGDVKVTFDCSALSGIDTDGIKVLKDMLSSGKRFILKDLSIDCRVLLKSEGLGSCFDRNGSLKKIELGNCPVISQGANGIIYRVSDEVVAKAYKSEPDYHDIVRERSSLKNALITGVPAPISLGYAEYDGRLVTLMELIKAGTLLEIISTQKDYEGYIVRYAQFIRKLHDIRDKKKLRLFRKNMFGAYILSKTDITDRVLPESYRGRAKKIIASINEPDCLIHGDIQPGNIMVSGEEMMFIDFDLFSAGKAVYDLGALYRTLFDHKADGIPGYNGFLKLPVDKCSRVWDIFTEEYYKEEPKEVSRQSIALARMIGIILFLAKHIKKKAGQEIIEEEAGELAECIGEFEKDMG